MAEVEVEEEIVGFEDVEAKRTSLRKGSLPVRQMSSMFESGQTLNSPKSKDDNRRQSIRQGQRSVHELKEEHEHLMAAIEEHPPVLQSRRGSESQTSSPEKAAHAAVTDATGSTVEIAAMATTATAGTATNVSNSEQLSIPPLEEPNMPEEEKKSSSQTPTPKSAAASRAAIAVHKTGTPKQLSQQSKTAPRSRSSTSGFSDVHRRPGVEKKRDDEPRTFAFGHATRRSETVDYLSKKTKSAEKKPRPTTKEASVPFSRATVGTKASASHAVPTKIVAPQSIRRPRDFDLFTDPSKSLRVQSSPHIAQPRKVQLKKRQSLIKPLQYDGEHTTPLQLQSATPGSITELRAKDKGGWVDVSHVKEIPPPELPPTAPEFILAAASHDYDPDYEPSVASRRKSPAFDNIDERRNRRDTWTTLKSSHDTFDALPPPPNAPQFIMKAISASQDSRDSSAPRPVRHSPSVDNIEERANRRDSWTTTKPSHEVFPEAPALYKGKASSRSLDEHDSAHKVIHSPSLDTIEERARRKDTWTATKRSSGEFPELKPTKNTPEFIKKAASRSTDESDSHKHARSSPTVDTIEERRNRKDSWTPTKQEQLPPKPRAIYTPPPSVTKSLSKSRSRDPGDSNSPLKQSPCAPPPLPSELAGRTPASPAACSPNILTPDTPEQSTVHFNASADTA